MKLTLEAVSLRRQGWTLEQIGQKFNCSKCAISRYLARRHGGSRLNKVRVDTPCAHCGGQTKRQHKFCSTRCYHQSYQTRIFIQWRQGQRIGRKVVAALIGPLPKGSVVHHEDGNEGNNDPKNLWLFACHADHQSYHRGGAGRPLWRGSDVQPLVVDTSPSANAA